MDALCDVSIRRRMGVRSSRALGVTVALLVVASASNAEPIAFAEPISRSVPIAGQAEVMGVRSVGTPVLLTVHAVRRLQGATAVYLSVGVPPGGVVKADEKKYVINRSLFTEYRKFSRFDGTSNDPYCDVAVVDQQGGKVYAPMSQDSEIEVLKCPGRVTGRPGELDVVTAVVAPVPAGVSTVDVSVRGVTFHDVPVGDGPLTPEVDVDRVAPLDEPGSHVVVGTGWPRVPAELIAKADLSRSVYDLKQETVGITDGVSSSQKTVGLDTDVLFAFDSAELTAKGRSAVNTAVADLRSKKAQRLSVVGYTDNQGSDAYNLTLSQRRAATVAAEIRRQLPGVEVASRGEGEKHPVTSNDTAQSRAFNRRVEITIGG